MRRRHATKQARRRWNNRNYYERHRDAIRARRRERYWKQRDVTARLRDAGSA
jgi:hypothetical protein